MQGDNENSEKIDIVLIWVDGNDIKWQEEKAKYDNNPNYKRSGSNRYREWDNLKYWFRGVEKFAPWINNIYFITCGHYPEWLNLTHPKLKFIKHDDYIPKEFLPTFSSHPIELNLHRIEELSDKFIYFNDDIFLINHVKPEDFFVDGKPRYIAGCDAVYSENYEDTFSHIALNNMAIINKYFNKKEVIKNNHKKWFCKEYGIKTLTKTASLTLFNRFSSLVIPHLAVPILKSTMNELWEKEKAIFEKTSSNKFRTKEDINQLVFSWYDIVRNNFEPSTNKLGNYYEIQEGTDVIQKAIEEQKYKMICISDDMSIDFEKAKEEINSALEKILPDKSSFEI